MFAATVINFLLSSLCTANQVAYIIVFVRKALILDIDSSLFERAELITSALRNLNIVGFWAGGIPVSISSCCCRIWYLFMLGADIAQRSHCHLEGLGPLPRSTVGSPHTFYSVDWIRG